MQEPTMERSWNPDLKHLDWQLLWKLLRWVIICAIALQSLMYTFIAMLWTLLAIGAVIPTEDYDGTLALHLLKSWLFALVTGLLAFGLVMRNAIGWWMMLLVTAYFIYWAIIQLPDNPSFFSGLSLPIALACTWLVLRRDRCGLTAKKQP